MVALDQDDRPKLADFAYYGNLSTPIHCLWTKTPMAPGRLRHCTCIAATAAWASLRERCPFNTMPFCSILR